MRHELFGKDAIARTPKKYATNKRHQNYFWDCDINRRKPAQESWAITSGTDIALQGASLSGHPGALLISLHYCVHSNTYTPGGGLLLSKMLIHNIHLSIQTSDSCRIGTQSKHPWKFIQQALAQSTKFSCSRFQHHAFFQSWNRCQNRLYHCVRQGDTSIWLTVRVQH